MIMSSKPANESTEIPVAEGVQKTDPKYLDDEVVETLVPEDSEAALLKLGGDSDNSEEPPWKAAGKYDNSKTRKDGEEVIQTTRDLVDLEQVIKREGRVRRKNRGGDLESAIKEERGKKGDDFETGGKEDLFESVEQEDFEKVRQDYYNPSDPPYPPRISQRTVLGRICKQLGRRITPHLEEFK